MSTDATVICSKCCQYHHLGQRMACRHSFGYGTADISGAAKAAEFVMDHIGHDLRIVTTDEIPEDFIDAEDRERKGSDLPDFAFMEALHSLWTIHIHGEGKKTS